MIKSHLEHFGTWVKDLVFPPCCHGCGRVDTHWCATCLVELQQLPLQITYSTLPQLDGCVATAGHTGKLQAAVHALKYYGQQDLANPLADRLAKALEETQWTYDSIIPVPLHISRLNERRYNQSEVLCNALMGVTGQPVKSGVLMRHRHTPPQVGLNRHQRLVNVADAFIATQRLTGECILLIDDVQTTGATLQACAQALRNSGANRVYALTVTAAPLS